MSIDTELSGRLGIRDGVNARVLSKNGENHTMQNILLRKKIPLVLFFITKYQKVQKKKKEIKKNLQKYEKKPIFYIKGQIKDSKLTFQSKEKVVKNGHKREKD